MAGLDPEAPSHLDEDLIGWVDRDYVVERHHREKIRPWFRRGFGAKQVIPLDTPDEYEFMRPELTALLKERLPRYADKLLAAHELQQWPNVVAFSGAQRGNVAGARVAGSSEICASPVEGFMAHGDQQEVRRQPGMPAVAIGIEMEHDQSVMKLSYIGELSCDSWIRVPRPHMRDGMA